MRALPNTPALLAVAKRVVWFKEPLDALNEPMHFLAHAMTYGTIEDLEVIGKIVDDAAYESVLDAALPGIFDRRSWAYWHVRLRRLPVPPLPERKFD
jgi:hypothetical protein